MKAFVFPLIAGIFVGISVPAHAGSSSPRTISVQAWGEIAAVPDVLVTRFWISRQGRNLAKVKIQIDDKARNIKKIFQHHGVSDSDFRIMQFIVSPQYDWQNGKKFIGYDVRREIELRLKDIGKYGFILDEAVAAGINHTGHIQLQLSNQQEIESQATVEAIKIAKRKANLLAMAAGATLGNVISIEESGSYQPQPRLMRTMAMDESAKAVPVEHVGESRIRKYVNLVFELR